MVRKLVVILALAALAAPARAAAPADGADLFVSLQRGANKNPGSKEAPFKDIQAALNEAPEGARIHVAQGTYTGRLKAGQYIVKQASIELIGGYADDFERRDPFANRTLITDDPEVKWPEAKGDGMLRLIGERQAVTEMKRFVLDGFFFDQGNKNTYVAGPRLGEKRDRSPMIKVSTDYSGATVEIRNCVLVNGGWEGITVLAKPNSKVVIENNIILNVIKGGIYIAAARVRPGQPDAEAETVIRNNTIAYTWQQSAPIPADPYLGRGSAIEVNRHGKHLIEKNVLAHGCEGGIFNDLNPRVTVNGNLFFDNYLSDYTFFVSGAKTHARASEFDETDLAASDNAGTDPDLEGLDEQFRQDRARFVFAYPEKLLSLYESVTDAEKALASGSAKPGPEAAQDFAVKNSQTGKVVDTVTLAVKKNQDGKYWGIRYPVEKALVFPRAKAAAGVGAQRTAK